MAIDRTDRERVGGGVAEAPERAPTRRGAGRATRLAARLAALAAVGAAAAWAYYANVTTSRPAMDMAVSVSGAGAPFPVWVVPVERGPVTGTVTYTGSVAPFNEEDIYPRVTGRIVEMPVYPGDAVRAGQVVARLDDVELGSRVSEASAAVAAAEATLAQMEADVVAARHGVQQMEREVAMAAADLSAAREGLAQMEREVAMAEADVVAAREGVGQMDRELRMVEAEAGYQEQVIAREERLFRAGAVSRQDVEAVRASAAAARARVGAAQARVAQQQAMVVSARAKADAARARVAQQQAMIVSAQAKLDAARARLEQARAMEQSALRKRDAMAAMARQSRAQLRTAEVVRDYVSIVAPSDGYVVKRLVAPGVLVQPGMAILKITQIDRVRLQANVGERDLAAIRVGSPITVTTTATAEPPLAARVTAVFPFVDQGPRTAVVEAVVDNRGRRLLPGQYVTMRFVTGARADALAVPRGAVARMGAQAVVWVVREDRVEPAAVTTGLEGPDRIEISAGLRGDERIVVRGLEPLYAGARVRDVSGAAAIRPEAPPATPRAASPDVPAPSAVGGPGRPDASSGKETPHGAGH